VGIQKGIGGQIDEKHFKKNVVIINFGTNPPEMHPMAQSPVQPTWLPLWTLYIPPGVGLGSN